MRTEANWNRGDLLLAAGTTVGLAAVADTAWSAYTRFALDLSGLTALERAAAALWDFRPLGTAVFAIAACAVLTALREPLVRLEGLAGPVRGGLVYLSAGFAAFAAVIVALAAWVAAAGRIGAPGELGFVFSDGERIVTLVTQVLAWLPLGVILALVAAVAAYPKDAPEPVPTESARAAELSQEMEALWQEHLAFGPKRERARALLLRFRALEQAGDLDGARALAEELRRL
jgi:hypothetical protein